VRSSEANSFLKTGKFTDGSTRVHSFKLALFFTHLTRFTKESFEPGVYRVMRNSTLALILLVLFAIGGFKWYPAQFIAAHWRWNPFGKSADSPKSADDITHNVSPTYAFGQYQDEARKQLLGGDFETLEAKANAIRTGKEHFPGGTWKLNAFYRGTSELEGSAENDAEWERLLSKLRQWLERYPDSITARTALGEALVNFALKARGNTTVDKVTRAGIRRYKERLEEAESVLAASKGSERCPHFYVSMLTIAMLNVGTSPSSMRFLMRQSQRSRLIITTIACAPRTRFRAGTANLEIGNV